MKMYKLILLPDINISFEDCPYFIFDTYKQACKYAENMVDNYYSVEISRALDEQT